MSPAAEFVLFPGRHHLLTRHQERYLRQLTAGLAVDVDGRRVEMSPEPSIVWAVTSANHHNTRRNPIPFHRREAAIERFSLTGQLRSLVIPVFDERPNARFAEVTLKNIENATYGDLQLTPDNTVLACSTPAVIELYQRLGFRVAPVELGDPAEPARPWDVLLMLVEGDPHWRELAHPATVDVFDRYRLVETVCTVHADPIVGDEGGLTDTRQYRTYVESFERAATRKWDLVSPYVKPGRVLDIGCASGGMLELASKDPRLWESDLLGVEVSRHLFEECVHKKAQGAFANPNVYFYQLNMMTGAAFPERSIDTTLTVALTHEIYSYGDGLASLRALAEVVYRHTAPGGVWVNSDVCGPSELDRPVRLRLVMDDGQTPAATRDLSALGAAEVQSYVGGLSTRGRFDQFARDFRTYAGVPFPYERNGADVVVLALADAMEFVTRKDYTDNWLSECHEQFCGLSYEDWITLLTQVGFDIDPASQPWRNDWLVTNRFAPTAQLLAEDAAPMDWPDTHLLLVARRPMDG